MSAGSDPDSNRQTRFRAITESPGTRHGPHSGIERKQGMSAPKSMPASTVSVHVPHRQASISPERSSAADNRSIDRLIREKQFPVRALLWCLCQRAGGERECDQDQTPAFMGNPFNRVIRNSQE